MTSLSPELDRAALPARLANLERLLYAMKVRDIDGLVVNTPLMIEINNSGLSTSLLLKLFNRPGQTAHPFYNGIWWVERKVKSQGLTMLAGCVKHTAG